MFWLSLDQKSADCDVCVICAGKVMLAQLEQARDTLYWKDIDRIESWPVNEYLTLLAQIQTSQIITMDDRGPRNQERMERVVVC